MSHGRIVHLPTKSIQMVLSYSKFQQIPPSSTKSSLLGDLGKVPHPADVDQPGKGQK